MRALLLPAALALAAAPALAAQVTPCDGPGSGIRDLRRPVSGAVRDFAEGRVGLAVLDQGEPACCGVRLAVLLPDPETALGLCRLVTTDDGQGWGALDLAAARASYDPARGLAVTLAGTRATGDGLAPVEIEVLIALSSATVTVAER